MGSVFRLARTSIDEGVRENIQLFSHFTDVRHCTAESEAMIANVCLLARLVFRLNRRLYNRSPTDCVERRPRKLFISTPEVFVDAETIGHNYKTRPKFILYRLDNSFCSA